MSISIQPDSLELIIVNSSGAILEKNHSKVKNMDLITQIKSFIKRISEKDSLEIQHVFVIFPYLKYLLEQGTRLNHVGVIRLAGHNPNLLFSNDTWPLHMKNNIKVDYVTVNGGYDFSGKATSEINKQEVLSVANKLICLGVKSFSVCGTFSPFFNDQEKQVFKWLKNKFDLPVTLSHEVGDLNFIERENMCILNSCLTTKEFSQEIHTIIKVLKDIGINAPVYTVKNDGGSILLENATNYPILLVESMLTCSTIGAQSLSKYKNSVVVHVEDNRMSFGFLFHNRLVKQPYQNKILDIPVNCTLPGFIHVPFGTKSTRNYCKSTNKYISAYDAAVLCGYIDDDEALNKGTDVFTAYKIIEDFEKTIVKQCKRMAGYMKKVPFLLVGRDSSMFCQTSQLHIPNFSDFSTSYGAANAPILYIFTKFTNNLASLHIIKEEVLAEAAQSGLPTPEIISCEVSPYHYIPGKWARVTIKVCSVLANYSKKSYDLRMVRAQEGYGTYNQRL